MNNTRKLTEGAMMAAIIGILLFLNRQSGSLFDFILYWITPIPLAVYTVKYGFKEGLLPYVVIVLLSLMMGMYTALYYCVFGGFVGLVYGYLVNKDVENHVLLLMTCSASIISTFISLFLLSSLFGYSLVDDMALMTQTMNEINAMFSDVSALQINMDLIPMIVIMSNVILGLLEGLLIYLFTHIVLQRLKIKVRRFKPISTLRLSKPMGIVICIFMLASYFMIEANILSNFQNILYFVYLICIIILMINGYIAALTIIAFYKKRKYVFLLIFGIFPPFNMILCAIGLLDSITNLRDELTIKKNR